jgi:hypothetical protein
MSIVSFFKSRELDMDFTIKWLPFTLFLFALATLYIHNGHKAERKQRLIQIETDSLKQIRWQYMTQQTKMVNIMRQSKLSKNAEEMGLKELLTSPRSIEIEK